MYFNISDTFLLHVYTQRQYVRESYYSKHPLIHIPTEPDLHAVHDGEVVEGPGHVQVVRPQNSLLQLHKLTAHTHTHTHTPTHTRPPTGVPLEMAQQGPVCSKSRERKGNVVYTLQWYSVE